MVLEVATLQARPGQAAAFAQAFARAQRIIAAMPGHGGHALQRCLGHDHRYALLVGRANLQDPTEGFRGSPHHQEWRALTHHSYDPFPAVLHDSPVFPSESGSIA